MVDLVQTQKLAQIHSEKKQVELKAAWREEWLRRQREKVVGLLQEQSDDSVKDLEIALLDEMETRNAHPSLIKRLRASGWDHQLVRHLMIDFYAKAAMGEDWDKPSIEELLDIASEAKI